MAGMVYRNQVLYRRVFVETYGDLPQPCTFCDESIVRWGRNGDEGHIHHLDGDYLNNDPANLAVAHNACHQRHHFVESLGDYSYGPKSPEVRAKIAATLTGRTDSDDTREHKAEAQRRAWAEGRRSGGYTLGDEAKAHIAAATKARMADPAARERLRAKSPCPDCGRELNASWMKRHKDEGRCHPSA